MSLGSVVFFEHQIVASPFEKNFHKVRCVRSLSTIRMRLFSFIPEPPIERDQENQRWFAAEESLLRLPCSCLFDHVLLVV